MRYIAVEREELREILKDDDVLADVLLSAFNARRDARQTRQRVGVEIIGPRSLPRTRETVAFVRGMRIPYTWRDISNPVEAAAIELPDDLASEDVPIVKWCEALNRIPKRLSKISPARQPGQRSISKAKHSTHRHARRRSDYGALVTDTCAAAYNQGAKPRTARHSKAPAPS